MTHRFEFCLESKGGGGETMTTMLNGLLLFTFNIIWINLLVKYTRLKRCELALPPCLQQFSLEPLQLQMFAAWRKHDLIAQTLWQGEWWDRMKSVLWKSLAVTFALAVSVRHSQIVLALLFRKCKREEKY